MHKGKIKESLPIDEIEEKYAIVEGSIEELVEKEEAFIGLRKGEVKFEGLMLREQAKVLFDDRCIKLPNVENLLVYTIWGEKDAKSEAIIKSL